MKSVKTSDKRPTRWDTAFAQNKSATNTSLLGSAGLSAIAWWFIVLGHGLAHK